jgi:hypothetical protein
LVATGTAAAPTLAVDTTVIAQKTDVASAIMTAQATAASLANAAQTAAQNASLPISGGSVTGAITAQGAINANALNSATTLQIPSKDVLKADANDNVAVGIGAMKTGAGAGKENTANGSQALLNLTSGGQNTACGKGALMSETTGTGNTAHGWNTLMNQNGGSNNVAIGAGAGKAYTSNESNNILVGNAGVQGESQSIRIGTDTGSSSQKTYIAGVWSRVTSDATTTQQVVIDQSGNLGTVPITSASTTELRNEMQKLSRDNAADQTEIAKLRSQVAEQLKQGREQQAALRQLVVQVQTLRATVARGRSANRHARVASASAKKKPQATATHPLVASLSSETGRPPS